MKEDKNINNLDDFSVQIKRKLSEHIIEPDEDLWLTIQKNINASKKIIPLWMYYAASAVAVVALLISVGNFFFMKESVIPVSEEIEVYQQEAKGQMINIKESPAILSEEVSEETPLALNTIKLKEEQVLVEEEVTYSVEKEDFMADVASKEELVFSVEEKGQEKEGDDNQVVIKGTEDVQVEDQSKKQQIVKQQTSLPTSSIQNDWTDRKSKKRKRKISISAIFGSGMTGSSATISPRSYAYRSESLVDIPTKLANVLTPRDFKQKEYLPPVSAGLNTRLPITDRFSVESGFMYTVLQTRLSNSISGADFRASVDLHYIGLPANFVYSMIKERRWDVYISAGGMMEKGLQSDFKQYQNWDNTRISLEATPNIEGLQWSLNSSIGIGYFVHQNIALFIDPKLSYYFDNNQPYSIRKELPVIFSLNTGLRVAL